jgi:hypothetical protein
VRERWIAAYVCVGIGACFSPAPPAGIPCGPGFSCPNDQTCDIVTNECGPPSEALILRDDTAEDFGVAGAYVDEVTIEKQGFVGPIAFLNGGVRITAYNGLFATEGAQFEDIAANTPSGVGLQRSLHIRFEDRVPPGLGVIDPENVTVTVEGEIELDSTGNWRFELTANDRGFFEIEDAPGSGSFTLRIDDDDLGTSGTLAVTTPGWYRYRGAFQDQTNIHDYRVRLDPPGTSPINDIPSDRMRVRADDLEGLIVDGFENAFMMEHKATLVSTSSLTELALNPDPFGLPIGPGEYSYRWNGQFLIEQGGAYTFRLDTIQGHRLWIDGVALADKYDDDSQTTITSAIELEPGWHDLVIDMMKRGGPQTSFLDFAVESGPQFAGGSFPADHLRPISGRGARFLSDRNLSALAIPDGPPTPPTPAARTLTLQLPASFTPLDVRAAVSIDHDLASSVQVVCDPPGTGAFTVAAFGSMPNGENFFHLPMQVENAVPSPWRFEATDNLTDGIIGEITGVMVTMIYDGGKAPFPTTYRYESAVRDLGDVVAFERIAWLLRQAPDPNMVVVRLRTCETADACAAETSSTARRRPCRCAASCSTRSCSPATAMSRRPSTRSSCVTSCVANSLK